MNKSLEVRAHAPAVQRTVLSLVGESRGLITSQTQNGVTATYTGKRSGLVTTALFCLGLLPALAYLILIGLPLVRGVFGSLASGGIPESLPQSSASSTSNLVIVIVLVCLGALPGLLYFFLAGRTQQLVAQFHEVAPGSTALSITARGRRARKVANRLINSFGKTAVIASAPISAVLAAEPGQTPAPPGQGSGEPAGVADYLLSVPPPPPPPPPPAASSPPAVGSSCAACGSILLPGDGFCVACGQAVSGPQAAQVPPPPPAPAMSASPSAEFAPSAPSPYPQSVVFAPGVGAAVPDAYEDNSGATVLVEAPDAVPFEPEYLAPNVTSQGYEETILEEPEPIPLLTADLISESTTGKVVLYDETARFTVGRDSSVTDLAVSDPRASRAHLAVFVRDGVPMVEDLGSSNGTYVNGVKIDSATALADDDRIRLGHSEIRFCLSEQ